MDNSLPLPTVPEEICVGIPLKCKCSKNCENSDCIAEHGIHRNFDCPHHRKTFTQLFTSNTPAITSGVLNSCTPPGARPLLKHMSGLEFKFFGCQTAKSWAQQGAKYASDPDGLPEFADWTGLAFSQASCLQIASTCLEKERLQLEKETLQLSNSTEAYSNLVSLKEEIQASLDSNVMCFMEKDVRDRGLRNVDPHNFGRWVSKSTQNLVTTHPQSRSGGRSNAAMFVGIDYEKDKAWLERAIPVIKDYKAAASAQTEATVTKENITTEVTNLRDQAISDYSKGGSPVFNMVDWSEKCKQIAPTLFDLLMDLMPGGDSAKKTPVVVMILAVLIRHEIFEMTMSNLPWAASSSTLNWLLYALGLSNERQKARRLQKTQAGRREEFLSEFMARVKLCEVHGVAIDNIDFVMNALLRSSLRSLHMTSSMLIKWPFINLPQLLPLLRDHAATITDEEVDAVLKELSVPIARMAASMDDIEATYDLTSVSALKDAFTTYNGSDKSFTSTLTILTAISDFCSDLNTSNVCAFDEVFFFPTHGQQIKMENIVRHIRAQSLRGESLDSFSSENPYPYPGPDKHQFNVIEIGEIREETLSFESVKKILDSNISADQYCVAIGDEGALKSILAVKNSDPDRYRNVIPFLGLWHLEKNFLEVVSKLVRSLGFKELLESSSLGTGRVNRAFSEPITDFHSALDTFTGIYSAALRIFDETCPKSDDETILSRAEKYVKSDSCKNKQKWKRLLKLTFGPLEAGVVLHRAIRTADYTTVLGLLKSHILPWFFIMGRPNYVRIIVKTLDIQFNTPSGKVGLLYALQGAGFGMRSSEGRAEAVDAVLESHTNLVIKKSTTSISVDRIKMAALTAGDNQKSIMIFEDSIRELMGLPRKYELQDGGQPVPITSTQRKADDVHVKDCLLQKRGVTFYSSLFDEEQANLPQNWVPAWDALALTEDEIVAQARIAVENVRRLPTTDLETSDVTFRSLQAPSEDQFSKMKKDRDAWRQYVAYLVLQKGKSDLVLPDLDVFANTSTFQKSALFSSLVTRIAQKQEADYEVNETEQILYDVVVLDFMTHIHRILGNLASWKEVVDFLVTFLENELKTCRNKDSRFVLCIDEPKGVEKLGLKLATQKNRDLSNQTDDRSAKVQADVFGQDVLNHKFCNGLKFSDVIKNRPTKEAIVPLLVALALQKCTIPVDSVLVMGIGGKVASHMNIDESNPEDGAVFLKKENDSWVSGKPPGDIQELMKSDHPEGDQQAIRSFVMLTKASEKCKLASIDSDLVLMGGMASGGETGELYISIRNKTWDISKFSKAALQLSPLINFEDIASVQALTGSDYNLPVKNCSKSLAVSCLIDGAALITKDGTRHIIDHIDERTGMVSFNNEAASIFMALMFLSLVPVANRGKRTPALILDDIIRAHTRSDSLDLAEFWKNVQDYCHGHIGLTGRSGLVPHFNAVLHHLRRSEVAVSMWSSGFRRSSPPEFKPEEHGYDIVDDGLVPKVNSELLQQLKDLVPTKNFCGCSTDCQSGQCPCIKANRKCIDECHCRVTNCKRDLEKEEKRRQDKRKREAKTIQPRKRNKTGEQIERENCTKEFQFKTGNVIYSIPCGISRPKRDYKEPFVCRSHDHSSVATTDNDITVTADCDHFCFNCRKEHPNLEGDGLIWVGCEGSQVTLSRDFAIDCPAWKCSQEECEWKCPYHS